MALLNDMDLQNKRVLNSKKVMLPILWGFLSGCAAPLGTVMPVGHSREEFERYVEEVFRFENSLTTEVMMMHASGELSDHDPIWQAEQTMHQVCKPLNEFVSRESEGLSTGFFLRRRVMVSARDCDDAAHELKKLLDET